MIIKHEYPFTMVDHEYFRLFITNLQPLFKLVTRNTVKSDILTIFREEKESLYRFFETFSGRISFTTDLWTSETQDAYLCLTAHYIDNDWNLQKKILNFVMMEGSHSSNEITKVIMACLLDWNVDKKVNTITLDNASTNDAIVRKVRDMLNRDNSLVLGGRFMHVRCTAHILNLIVRDGLSVIAQALDDIRESCKFVKASPQRKLKFVQFYYNLIYGADHKTYVTEVQSTLFELYNEYVSQPNSTHSSPWSNFSVGESSTGNVSNKFKWFETWCHKEGYDTTSNKSELEQYLEELIFPSEREFNILNWWKMNSLKYPTLSKLARDILTIPVSWHPNLLSLLEVLNEYRSSLAPETLQALICSQNWLKSAGVGNIPGSSGTINAANNNVDMIAPPLD